jgi:hypothetical protein
MKRVFFRELKPYSELEIARRLGGDVELARNFIERMMARGVIRYRSVTAPDGVDLSDEEDARPDELYQFAFVGMASFGDIVAISYPKYFRNRKPNEDELRQLFDVLKRDVDAASILRLAEDADRGADKLPVMLALLDLYSEYGVYSNYVDGFELNGAGVIDWNRTIGRHLPLVQSDFPIYVDYESRKTLRDESDYITRLHRAVLTEISAELRRSGIANLLDVEDVSLSEEDVDAFGDDETVRMRLERERGSQFMDWKISVLALLERYLLDREHNAEEEEVRALGTTSFYGLWEKACKVAFGDKLDRRLGALGIPLVGKWKERRRETLLEIIPRQTWERREGGCFVSCGNADTLIPDTIALHEDADGSRVFCIFDAKYYVPTLSGKMRKQPGLESVTKQFLYQTAYKDFVLDHGFTSVVNAFLVPTCDDEPFEIGRVSFPEVMGVVEPPFSNYIEMWALPASSVLAAYLDGRETTTCSWKALWEQGDPGQREV